MNAQPISLIPEAYRHAEQLINATPFNAAGVSLTPIGSADIANLSSAAPNKATLVWVRLQPSAKVGAHLHEAGGEVELPLTPIISVISEALRTTEGAYELDGDVIKAAEVQPVLLQAFLPIQIAPQQTHEFINPRDDAYADILFFLPDDHATATDKKLVTSQYADEAALKTLREVFIQKTSF